MKTNFIILIFLFAIFSCNKNTTGPGDNPPAGYQEDITWQSVVDSPWPMFQNNPQMTGRSKYLGPKNGNIIWEKKFDAIPKPGFITICKDSSILMATGNFKCDTCKATSAYLLNISKTGEIKWMTNIFNSTANMAPELFTSPVISSEGIIYIGSLDGNLYAINPDGTLRWKFDAKDGITSRCGGLNIGKDGAIYFTTKNKFFALNKNGNLIFEIPGYSNSPVSFSPDGNTLYINKGFESLDAMDLTGTKKWSINFTSPNWTVFPLVDSHGNLFFSLDDSTYCSADNNGNIRWKYKIQTKGVANYDDFIDCSIASTIDKDGNIYFVTGACLYSLDYFGNFRWRINSIGSTKTHLVCDVSGTIYAVNGNDRKIYSVNKDGVILWSKSLNDPETVENLAPAISYDGSLILIAFNNNNARVINIK